MANVLQFVLLPSRSASYHQNQNRISKPRGQALKYKGYHSTGVGNQSPTPIASDGRPFHGLFEVSILPITNVGHRSVEDLPNLGPLPAASLQFHFHGQIVEFTKAVKTGK
ncbi:hypothetical protein E4U58_003152 [Claviceps cyperi]|nr:hypothetical protein E4U58_003152 [Claviceps cyperi]